MTADTIRFDGAGYDSRPPARTLGTTRQARNESPRWGRWALAVAAGGALLGWAFRDLEVGSTLEVLGGAHLGWLVAALGLDLFVIYNRSLKWRCLLPEAASLRQSDVFRATAIGIMLNNVLPIRLDEPFRAFLLSRKSGIPAATVFGTIVLERLWDGAVLLAILATLTTWLTLPEAMSMAGIVSAVIVASLLAVVGIGLALGSTRVGRSELLRSFRAGLTAPKSTRAWVLPPVLCAVEWLASIAFLICVARAIGIHLPATLTLVIQTAHNISFAFAVLPGGIGLMETLDRALLTAWGGIAPAQMFGFMLLSRLMLSVPATLLGLSLLEAEGLRLASIGKATLPGRPDAASL